MQKEKRNRIIDWCLFAVALLAISAITLWLFYKQTMGSPERYHSDMKAYILEMQGLDSGYDFPYPVFFKLSALIHLFASPELAVAIATMLLNSLSILITKISFHHLATPEMKEGWARKVLLSGAAISLFFISMLYPPAGIYLPGIKFKYPGVFTANPFHNATYMAARPFAILAFLWYVKLLPVYEEGICKDKGKVRDYILFSLFLLLATMTKPSFTIVMLGTAGVLMLFRLFRSGFRNLLPTLQLGICFIPTFADLLYQYKGVFAPEEGAERGIGFCFGEVWAQYCTNVPLAVCLAIGFPLLVLVLNGKEWKKDILYRFAWQFYLMSFAMAFLLYEKGFRMMDFNFSWGYMYGIFFCHMGALLVLLRSMWDRKKPLLIGLQWMAYLWHLVCGLCYFKDFLQGKMYY